MKIKLLICLVFPTILFAQQQKERSIDSLFQKAFKNDLFNGNVLVIDQNKVVYRKAVGYADMTKTVRLTTEHRFHIGSIAKEFNSVGIMLLKEQGKLRLEDSLSKFLPQLPSWSEKIKVKDLLGYTSGIPDIDWNTVQTDADNMKNLMQIKNLNFEPGTQYEYNNNNVFLQRRIIESITKLTFNEFVQKELLNPSQMGNAIIDPKESDKLIARAFDDQLREDPLHVPISGWVALTLDDFYKWTKSILRYQIISPESTRFLLIPYAPSRQTGLGFNGQMDQNKIVNFEHDGTARNYQALLVCNPEKGRVVILMTNNKQNNLYEFNLAIQNILDHKAFLQPKKPVFPLLKDEIEKLSGKQIVIRYQQLRKIHEQTHAFDKEETLNELGYYLLNKNRKDDAIEVFQYNTQLFPSSWNAFDSLAEAYLSKEDHKNALKNYKRSIELGSMNENVKNIIKQLESKL